MATNNETQERRGDAQPYVAPEVKVLGLLTELTLGHPGPKSDGVGPGSLITR